MRIAVKILFCAAAMAAAMAAGAVPEGAVQVRAASFNIRVVTDKDTGDRAWKNRRAGLVAYIRDTLRPDVIGFQEVKSANGHDQRKYIMDNLSGYGFKSRMNDMKMCNMVAWRRDKFKCTGDGTFWLTLKPNKANSKFAKSKEARLCTWVTLKDLKTGKEICFASTHLDLNEGVRARQMKAIMDYMRPRWRGGTPFILVGDMNCYETEDTIAKVATAELNDAMLVSKRPPKGPWRTFNGWGWRDPAKDPPAAYARTLPVPKRCPLDGGKRIDFMLVSKDIVVESFEIRNETRKPHVYYSDHFPIIGNLSIPLRGGK